MAKGTLVKGTTLFVGVVPQPNPLTVSQFEALLWTEVCCPSTSPSFSRSAEIVSQNCINGEEINGVGATTGAETTLTLMYNADCVGQDIIRNAFGGAVTLALKKVYPDSPNPVTTTNTTIYTRVLVFGDADGGEEANSWITNEFQLKIVQDPILVKPKPV